MPAAIEYIPPTDPKRAGFSGAVNMERGQRQTQYKQALAYYLGQHPRQYEMPEPDEDDEDDVAHGNIVDHNTVVNMVKMTADRTASFLFPNIPDFELSPDQVDETEEEAWLRDMIEYNGGLAFLTKWVLRGFLAGHTFIKVLPGKPFPTITLLDPTSVSVFWKADEASRVIWFEQRYFVGQDLYIQDIVQVSDNAWKIYIYKQPNGAPMDVPEIPTAQKNMPNSSMMDMTAYGAAWELVGTGDHSDAMPPIISCPHLPHPDDYYGIGEARNMTMQDAINRLMSELSRITSENADPIDVVTGAHVLDVQDNGNIMTITNPAAKVQRLELKSDMAGLQKLIEQRMDIFLAEARVVLLKGEAKDLQRVTNASVRTLFLDMLSKNGQLQASYGAALKGIARLALKMSDKATRHLEHKIRILFGSALPTDMTELANINAIMDSIGAFSLQTMVTDMGKDWATEQTRIESEAEWKNKLAADAAKSMAEAVPPEPGIGGQPGAPKPKAGATARQSDKPDNGSKPAAK